MVWTPGGSLKAVAIPKFTLTYGKPTAGTWIAGQVAADLTGRLWVCTVGGTPGTWRCTAARRLAFSSDNTLQHAVTTTVSYPPTLIVDPVIEDRDVIISFYLPFCNVGSAGSMAALLYEVGSGAVQFAVYSPGVASATGIGSMFGQTHQKKYTAGMHTFQVGVATSTAATGTINYGFQADSPAWISVDEVI